MAVCSPHVPPNVLRSEFPEILGAAFNSRQAQEFLKEFPRMTTPRAISRIRSDVANMLGLDYDQLERFFVRQGWMTPSGNMASQKYGTYELGFMTVATKIFLESRAGGIQQLADSFMAKISAGQSALAEGLQLAKELKGLAKFQGISAGADMEMGWNLRLQRYAAADQEDALKVGRQTIDVDEVGDPIAKTVAYQGILERAASQLGDPETFQEGIDTLIDVARRIQAADRPQDVISGAAYYNLPARLFEEIYINGLLSAPQTIAVNATSVTWGVARQMLRLGGARLLEGAAGLLGQTGTAGTLSGFLGSPEQYRAVAAESAAGLTAMQSAMSDGFLLAWRAAKDEREFYKTVRGGVVENRDASKAITGVNIRQLATENGWAKPEQFSDGVMNTIDQVGQFVRIPTRFAMFGDQFTKHLVVRAEIASQAVRTAVLENVDPEDPVEFRKILDRELSKAYMYQGDEPQRLSAAYDYYSRITRQADEATFQEDNSLARALNQAINKVPALRPFFPFVRTPLNILRQGFYESTALKPIFETASSFASNPFSPTRAVLEIQQKMLADPAETARIAGQIALSTLLIGTIYSKVQDGTIVGGGPGRWSKNGMSSDVQKNWARMIGQTGRVPYSVKLGDTSIPFDRFGEPMAIVMRMAADIGMLSSYASQTEQDDMMGAYVGIVTSAWYQASFLAGVQQLSEVLNDKNTPRIDQKIGAGVQNYLAALTPFGGMLNYLDKSIDPYRHIYGSEGITKIFDAHENAMGRGVFGKMFDRIPGAGNTPMLIDQLTGLPVPVTVGGGPNGLNPLQMAVPFLPRGYNDADSVWKMVYDINSNYAEKRPGAKDVVLTMGEQQRVNAEMAKTEINGITVSDAIRRFHARADVQEYIRNKRGLYSSVRTGIEQEFDDMVRQYFDAALDKVVGSSVSMVQRKALGIDAAVRAKANDPEGASSNMRRIVELMRQAE